ncbi:MAG: hypothetical protein PWP27_2618 [Clostridiales bacterium]|jgi:hypothetical protein|nr:hypothetical protein [Clostridiales bacterium]MDK2934808.1 hypothetical protein [Clostridiales bacterium]
MNNNCKILTIANQKVRPGGIIAFITSKGTMDKENQPSGGTSPNGRISSAR